jgi:pSer/pThr/pTyr-binding forkhead associated (FHA) protein
VFSIAVTALRILLLAGLYLFLAVVLRTVVKDARIGRSDASPRLVVLKGAAARGVTFPLSGEVVAGRGRDIGVSVEDEFISVEHARLAPSGSGYSIEDLGSKNGTFINGRRLAERTALKAGDRLKLGETVFQYLE